MASASRRGAGGVRARFVSAGAVLLLTTIASAAFGGFTLAHVSRVVDESVRASAERNSLAAGLAQKLEREDDALLIALNGDTDRAKRELDTERANFAAALARVREVTTSPEGKTLVDALARAADDYRVEGDALLAHVHDQGARDRYHDRVNPVLRHAVAACTALREHSFVRLQAVAEWARDRTHTAVAGVIALVLGGLVLAALVVAHLGRVVVWPLRELTQAVDRMRGGEFGHRIAHGEPLPDELARLVDGFNEMAKEVDRFRRSGLDEVLRTKQTLEATLASLPDAVVLIDANSRVLSANAATIDLLGEDVRVGSALEDTGMPASVVERVRDVIAGRVPSVLPDSPTEAFDHRDRRLLARVVATQGLAILSLHDVTEFARLDEMRAELIAVAAHELRTPLTTLRMMLLLLAERTADDATLAEMSKAALSACDALGGTVDEFLDLARIEAGKLRLAMEQLDVRSPLDEAVAALRPQLDDAGLSVDVAARDELITSGDRARLRCVFTNLLANAVKYAPRGSHVRIELSRSPSNVEVSIEDEGPGIPAEFRERVFEKFFRVEHHTNSDDKGVRGSGVGLFLVREIVSAHGGDVRCESGADNRGARFVLKIPAAA